MGSASIILLIQFFITIREIEFTSTTTNWKTYFYPSFEQETQFFRMRQENTNANHLIVMQNFYATFDKDPKYVKEPEPFI